LVREQELKRISALRKINCIMKEEDMESPLFYILP